ncbi:MAG: hypothetical protein NZ519_08155, partial [Bacteroidia bacterium]|nr:hypothetical protein [Bacteroidia bacterium]
HRSDSVARSTPTLWAKAHKGTPKKNSIKIQPSHNCPYKTTWLQSKNLPKTALNLNKIANQKF